MRLITTFAALAAMVTVSSVAHGAEGGHHYEFQRQKWTFGGFFGQYDKAQLQRGFQVYQQVCASCHGLERVRWRNLVEKGGPEFPEEAVKKLAAEWPNQPLAPPNEDGRTTDNKGNLLTRKAILADPILGPYRNEKEARSVQNGALPPDLSLMAKARDVHNAAAWYVHVPLMVKDIATGYQEGGPDYIYNLLLAYSDAPGGMKMADGMNYNKAYPGNQIAMAAPITKDGPVKYENGAGSLEENAHDVSAFLSWAADPHLNQRKAMGWSVLLYLVITCVLLYLGKKRIWARAH